MKNPLRKFLARFEPSKPSEPLLLDADFQKRVDAVLAPAPAAPPKPRGRVIKQTRHSEFNPNSQRQGGRIVKVMPRQLQKIKAAQEKFEDDGQQPSVEELED